MSYVINRDEKDPNLQQLCKMVSFGVINYNDADKLFETLTKLTKLYPCASIFVVDDGSTDSSVVRVKRNFPQIEVFEMEENIGRLNRARAKAITECRTPYLMLMDNDISYQKLCVSTLLECLRKDKAIITTRPRLVYHDRPDTIYQDASSIHFLGVSANNRRGSPIFFDKTEAPKDSFGGGIMLINIAKAIEIGNFDDRYLVGWGDDAEFSVRGRLCGHRSVQCSNAVAYHIENPPGRQRITGQFYNRWRFITTLYSLRTLIAIAPALLVFELVLAILFGIGKHRGKYWRAVGLFLKEFPEIWQRRQAIQSKRVEMSDHCFLSAGQITLTGHLGSARFVQDVATLMSRILEIYWKVVSSVVGHEIQVESSGITASETQND